MGRLIFGLSFSAVFGLMFGIIAGGLFLAISFGMNIAELNNYNPFLLLQYLPTPNRITTAPFMQSYLIVIGSVVAFILLASYILFFDRLSTYGDAHFQDKSELRRNGMLQPVGAGLLFGKYCPPPKHPKGKPITISKRKPIRSPKNAPFISASYDQFPNAMLVAPTGAGKTVSYVIPVALTFPGSLVVLDVKGEIFEETARHRAKQGDTVYRFSPFDFERESHQYNPLHRISQITDLEHRFTELQKVASLFLQVEGASAQDFVDGGGELFVAAGMLAIQRGNSTFGEIYRIIYGSGTDEDIGTGASERLVKAAKETRYQQARQILSEYAGMETKIRDSYLSVLKSAGLRQLSNPSVERITRRKDIDFTTIRKKPQAIYLVVASDDLDPLSSLIRLFFTELMAFLRHNKPPKDEPWPVKIMLDEFDQLGHMPIFVDGLKQIRGHGGRVSIVTQSIPGLQTIYTESERQSLEAGAGVKIYITANEDVTASEIETSLGTRTGIHVSHSHARGALGFASGTVSKHSEDRPLLSAAQIRRLDDKKVIILPQRQQPILAQRIEYFNDPYLAPLWEAQKGTPLPYPPKAEIVQEQMKDELTAEREKRRRLEADFSAKFTEMQKQLEDLQSTKSSQIDAAVKSAAEAIMKRNAADIPSEADVVSKFGQVGPAQEAGAEVTDDDSEIISENVAKLNALIVKAKLGDRNANPTKIGKADG
ncbi:MAG: type IV secretory system conjugative DNA transfer family protein [Hyphomicrobiaceae bacterium]